MQINADSWLVSGTLAGSIASLNGTLFTLLGEPTTAATAATVAPLAVFGLGASIAALDRSISSSSEPLVDQDVDGREA